MAVRTARKRAAFISKYVVFVCFSLSLVCTPSSGIAAFFRKFLLIRGLSLRCLDFPCNELACRSCTVQSSARVFKEAVPCFMLLRPVEVELISTARLRDWQFPRIAPTSRAQRFRHRAAIPPLEKQTHASGPCVDESRLGGEEGA